MRSLFSLFTTGLLVCGPILSACSGGESMPSAAPAQGASFGGKHSGSTTYTFVTVDDPNSNVNAVTAINASGTIVGNFGAGTSSSPLESYLSGPPYQNFETIDYSKAQATVATGLTNDESNLTVTGYVISPSTLPGTWAFVYVGGLWYIYKDHKEGKGKKSVTEILGTNSSDWAVGYFTNPYGNNVAVQTNTLTELWTKLAPPGAVNAEATGINTVGDMSGWETTASAANGFFVRVGQYYTYSFPGAATTEGLSLNSADQIAGTYQLTASGIKHGFVLTGPTNSPSQQSWQRIDDPNGVNGTVVRGINDSGQICGYYIDGSGIQHGFVATPSK